MKYFKILTCYIPIDRKFDADYDFGIEQGEKPYLGQIGAISYPRAANPMPKYGQK